MLEVSQERAFLSCLVTPHEHRYNYSLVRGMYTFNSQSRNEKVFSLLLVQQHSMVFQEFEFHQAPSYLIFPLGKFPLIPLGMQIPNHWFYDNDVQLKAITYYGCFAYVTTCLLAWECLCVPVENTIFHMKVAMDDE